MPIAKNTGKMKKLIVLPKALNERLEKYCKETVKSLNMSNIICLALDLFLRDRGY